MLWEQQAMFERVGKLSTRAVACSLVACENKPVRHHAVVGLFAGRMVLCMLHHDAKLCVYVCQHAKCQGLRTTACGKR